MALIEVTLTPAWKRIVKSSDETEAVETTEDAEMETTPAPKTVEIEEADESSTGKRRLVTLRRLLALGVVAGAVVAIRRFRGMGTDATDEDPAIDVETPDETAAEQ